MMDIKKLDSLRGSIYGWEYAVERNLKPTITWEEIQILYEITDEFENLLKEVEDLRIVKQAYEGMKKAL